MKIYLHSAFLAVLLAGCATSEPVNTEPWQQKANNPPKHAARVKIVMIDSSPRDKHEHVDVHVDSQTIQRKFKKIARLNCEGKRSEEKVMTEAIIYRARMMGADAVIIDDSDLHEDVTGGILAFPFGSGGRAVFRATAVVYEDPKN